MWDKRKLNSVEYLLDTLPADSHRQHNEILQKVSVGHAKYMY